MILKITEDAKIYVHMMRVEGLVQLVKHFLDPGRFERETWYLQRAKQFTEDNPAGSVVFYGSHYAQTVRSRGVYTDLKNRWVYVEMIDGKAHSFGHWPWEQVEAEWQRS